MAQLLGQLPVERVALRKESVDRNYYHLKQMQKEDSRSPQGERG